MTSVAPRTASTWSMNAVSPGILLSGIVALVAFFVTPYVGRFIPIPTMMIALLVGIALNAGVVGTRFQEGTSFCVKVVLRWAVALLGLRVALVDVAALGLATASLVIFAMALTLASGFLFARIAGQRSEFGALVGAATAVCGASAALATSAFLPEYPGKKADLAFVVVGANAMATVAMLSYPALCLFLGFGEQATGIVLGGSIHDVAQVAGAGYAVSPSVGNAAVIVKLFRVLLLLPVVLFIGWQFAPGKIQERRAGLPVPMFAVVFVVLCVLQSALSLTPALAATLAPAKSFLVELSTWGLLLAISALGLETSLPAIIQLGWRHLVTMVGVSAVILTTVAAGVWIGLGGGQ